MLKDFSWIRRLRRGEAMADPVMEPPGFKARLPEKDEVDEIPKSNRSEHPPRGKDRDGRAFIIVYRNANGDDSERRITVCYTYQERRQSYILAHCHERASVRCFRLDRISALYCGATGEALNPIKSYLEPEWIKAETKASTANDSVRRRRTNPNLKQLRAALRVLMTLSRCDGHVHPLELDVVSAFLADVGPSCGLSEAEVLEMCSYAALLAPSFTGFLGATELAFSKKGQFSFNLVQAARRLVIADHKITDDEHAMIDDLMMLARAYDAVKPGDQLVPLLV